MHIQRPFSVKEIVCTMNMYIDIEKVLSIKNRYFGHFFLFNNNISQYFKKLKSESENKN